MPFADVGAQNSMVHGSSDRFMIVRAVRSRRKPQFWIVVSPQPYGGLWRDLGHASRSRGGGEPSLHAGAPYSSGGLLTALVDEA